MQAVTNELQLNRAQALREAAKTAYEAAEHLARLVDEAVTAGEPLPNLLASYAWRTEYLAMMARSNAAEYCQQLAGEVVQ